MIWARCLTVWTILFAFAFRWVNNTNADTSDLGTIKAPSNIPSLEGFLTNIIRLTVIAAFIAALIFLIIGGIQWIVAGGEPKATQAARAKVTAAIVGLAIVISSFVIIKAVETFFQVSIISGGNISIPLP